MMAIVTACTPIPGGTAIREVDPVRPKRLASTIPGMLPQVARLLEDTADHFSVEVEEVRSKLRTKNVVAARHVFWWVARNSWQLSFPELGKLLGKSCLFDHTTVMSACSSVDDHVRRGTLRGLVAKALRGDEEVQLTLNGASAGPTSSSGSNEGSGG